MLILLVVHIFPFAWLKNKAQWICGKQPQLRKSLWFHRVVCSKDSQDNIGLQSLFFDKKAFFYRSILEAWTSICLIENAFLLAYLFVGFTSSFAATYISFLTVSSAKGESLRKQKGFPFWEGRKPHFLHYLFIPGHLDHTSFCVAVKRLN